MDRSSVRVRVPATSANLGPGFDALGLALTLYDDVEVTVAERGLSVEVEGEGAGTVGDGERHLVVRAFRFALERLRQEQPPGLVVRCVNRIPHGRGLGSSAAAIVAGVRAAAAVSVRDVDVDEELAIATAVEGHPDNVAACLAGGLTIAWQAGAAPRLVRLDVDPGVEPVVFVPDHELATVRARGLLPESVPHGDAATNAGRAALLVAALTTGCGPEVLLDATADLLHQRYRASAMPKSVELVERLRERGVPAVVSGAGPSVLALAKRRRVDSMSSSLGNEWHKRPLSVDPHGARVQRGGS